MDAHFKPSHPHRKMALSPVLWWGLGLHEMFSAINACSQPACTVCMHLKYCIVSSLFHLHNCYIRRTSVFY